MSVRVVLRITNGVTVAAMAALALSGCSGTPTGPSPANHLAVGDSIRALAGWSAPAGSAALNGSAALEVEALNRSAVPSSVSWRCFTAAFAASIDCPAAGFTSHPVDTAGDVPLAPTTLQQVVQGTTVHLQWGAPLGPDPPTSYVVEAGSAPGLSDITTFDTGSTATALTVTDVPIGTYFVRVRARNASGIGPASNEVTVVVGSAPPPPPGPGPCAGPAGTPTNLVAAVIGAAIALNWESPSGCEPESYLIVAGSAPGAGDIARVITGHPGTSYSVSGVGPGTYYVFVSALVGSTSSAPSNIVEVTVTGIVPPGTTTWTGLVANGDGVTVPNDEDCGFTRLDANLTLVQSGSSITGFVTVTIRVAATCEGGIGFSDTQPIAGTVTGSLASGSGTITATMGSGSEAIVLNGTFSNGRMTGTSTAEDGSGTFAINRQ